MAKDLEYYLAQARRISKHREADAEKEIRKLYKSMLKELQAFVADAYTKYAEDDKLTFAMLQKAGYDARFLSEIEERISVATPKAAKELRQLVNDTYRIAYDGMVDAVVKGGNLDEAFADAVAITPHQIKKIVKNPIMDLALEKNHKDIIYDIKQAVAVGLMNGDRYTDMAHRISEKVDGAYYKSVRIARTEAHRVIEAGNSDAAIEADKEFQNGTTGMRMVKTWKTMRDERVRPQRRRKGKGGWSTTMGKGANHMKLEGQVVLAGEDFDLLDGNKASAPGQSGVAGHDINCRCYASYEMMTDEEYYAVTGKHFSEYKADTQTPENTQPEGWTPEEVTKARKRINKRMKTDGQLNDRQFKEFEGLMSEWSDDQVMVYDAFTRTKLKRGNYHASGGAYYQPGGDFVSMDINDNTKERHLRQSFTAGWHTKFHEEFHQIDYTLFKKAKSSPRLSNTAGTKAFKKAFESDIIKLAQEHTSFKGKTLTSLTANQRAVSDLASYLLRNYPTEKKKAQINLFTDGLGLATKDVFSPHRFGFWGHDSKYNQRGMQQAAKEVWASYGGCIMSNDKEQREVLDQIMPETMKLMDDWFKIVVDACR